MSADHLKEVCSVKCMMNTANIEREEESKLTPPFNVHYNVVFEIALYFLQRIIFLLEIGQVFFNF
jgi:hypothetical protein